MNNPPEETFRFSNTTLRGKTKRTLNDNAQQPIRVGQSNYELSVRQVPSRFLGWYRRDRLELSNESQRLGTRTKMKCLLCIVPIRDNNSLDPLQDSSFPRYVGDFPLAWAFWARGKHVSARTVETGWIEVLRFRLKQWSQPSSFFLLR